MPQMQKPILGQGKDVREKKNPQLAERNKARMIPMVGRRFGSVSVLSCSEIRSFGRIFWACVCDCGEAFDALGASLRNGETTRCKKCNVEYLRHIQTTHGESNNKKKPRVRLYTVWCSMRWRCYHKANTNYEQWGGRGIKVCDEWMDYHNFKAWAINNGYKNHLTIDRINNDGDYTPENCRWATWTQQANNTRVSRIIEHNGAKRTLAQWERHSGILRDTISARIKSGWPIDRALGQPVKRQKNSRTVATYGLKDAFCH